MPVVVRGAPAGGGDGAPPPPAAAALFSFGRKLGDGAFGTVYSCIRRCDGQELAVKLVDVVERSRAEAVWTGRSRSEAVWREAQILASLAHPNVVRFHGVFSESTCLCIVMERLLGGDMVDGLRTHSENWGDVDGRDIVSVVRQMTRSIRYVHHKLVVHRDVKGDNFLLDRLDLRDPSCRVVLADFGAACRLRKPGERMSALVGTKRFAPPEFFDGSYSAKVDVWALGVVVCGLTTGKFPFRDETEIRSKGVCIPKSVYPPVADFIDWMLTKDEAARPDSDQAMGHPYLNSGPGPCLELPTPAVPAGAVAPPKPPPWSMKRLLSVFPSEDAGAGWSRGVSPGWSRGVSKDSTWSRGLSPDSAEQRVACCLSGVGTSSASTVEPLSWTSSGPEGSGSAARWSQSFATAQLQAVRAASPAYSPPEAGVTAKGVLLCLGWLCCS